MADQQAGQANLGADQLTEFASEAEGLATTQELLSDMYRMGTIEDRGINRYTDE
jgi:hypothetical protein